MRKAKNKINVRYRDYTRHGGKQIEGKALLRARKVRSFEGLGICRRACYIRNPKDSPNFNLFEPAILCKPSQDSSPKPLPKSEKE